MWRGSLTINVTYQVQSLLEVKVCTNRRVVIIHDVCDIRGFAITVYNIYTLRLLLDVAYTLRVLFSTYGRTSNQQIQRGPGSFPAFSSRYIYHACTVVFCTLCNLWRQTVAQLVEALRYNPEDRGFDSQFYIY
jgi:hypothetical protein